MTPPHIVETCGCGASIDVGVATVGSALDLLASWRADHHCRVVEPVPDARPLRSFTTDYMERRAAYYARRREAEPTPPGCSVLNLTLRDLADLERAAILAVDGQLPKHFSALHNAAVALHFGRDRPVAELRVLP